MLPAVPLLFSCTLSRKSTHYEHPYTPEKHLIITADDFGAAKNINEGIRVAAEQEAITTISAFSNFAGSLPELKEISTNHPGLSIGVHLNITTGKPVLAPDEIPTLVCNEGRFYTIEELLPKLKNISIEDLRKELRAQVLALKNQDIPLDFLSDHNGVLTMYSPFFEVVTALAEEFHVSVRTPVLAGAKHPTVFGHSEMAKYARRMAGRMTFRTPFKAIHLLKFTRLREMERKTKRLDTLGIPHPDLFIESFWGNPTPANLTYILEHLPAGTSEIVVHLGTASREETYPSGLDLTYFSNREAELSTLTGNAWENHCKNLNITRTSYSNLSVHDIRK